MCVRACGSEDDGALRGSSKVRSGARLQTEALACLLSSAAFRAGCVGVTVSTL